LNKGKQTNTPEGGRLHHVFEKKIPSPEERRGNLERIKEKKVKISKRILIHRLGGKSRSFS